MPIEEIDLVSFRNHDHIKLKFGTGLNVIYGENGSGKTALMEAIYLLSIGRSFRTSQYRTLLKNGTEFLQVSGKFRNDDKKETVQLNQGKNGRRRFLVNGLPINSLKDLIGKNPVVILSPEEQTVTKGNPADRRTFFDRLFSIVSKEYVITLSEYGRILKQRNTALDLVKNRKASGQAVIAWNQPLVNSGIKIWFLREKLIQQFAECLSKACERYGENNLSLACRYESSAEKSQTLFMRELENNLRREIALGRTLTGPHRDNYAFFFQGKELKQFGSQGEHKLSLVLIKLAELYLIQNLTGTVPIFLLDDLFAKLDLKRGERVLYLLNKSVQTIVTTTELINVARHGIDFSSGANKAFHLERVCKT